MEEASEPQCYIVAGSNGAGKTTFALTYLPLIVSCHDFINADEIAKGLPLLDDRPRRFEAGKIFWNALEKKIEARKDFAFETTLAGRTYLRHIEGWRSSGWKVTLFYLYLPSAEFSAMRVQQRVLQGGHDIPLNEIQRRYPRSVQNLFAFAEICDSTFCFDNTGDKVIPIFEKRFGQPASIQDPTRFSTLLQSCKES